MEAAASEEEDAIAEEVHAQSDNDDVGIEISHIYKDRAADVIPTHQNPMHGPEGMIRLDKNITSVQAQNMDLKKKNANLEFELKIVKEKRADLEFENKNVKDQNQILQQRVRDLESQERNREK